MKETSNNPTRNPKGKAWLAFLSLLVASILMRLPTPASAAEDPPGCSFPSGTGNTSIGGINFNLTRAHIGDTVSLFASLGMGLNACKATNVTGTVYIATGPVADFMVNQTLNPDGVAVQCPANAKCQPGPYQFTITPALVGATVVTPNGTAPGAAKTVRAVANGFGTVLTSPPEQLTEYHSASLTVVTPCLQVFKQCDFTAGQSCFAAGTPVRFSGYVTNCGDIALTNVVVLDNRAGQMTLLNPTNGSPLSSPFSLAPGAYAVFSNSFTPTLQETCSGNATNIATATATDTTPIGGPRASVTNSYTDVCPICVIPAITVSKACPATPTAAGGVLTFSGVVSNAGNVTLTNVVILNDRPAANTAVTNFATLAPGATASFTGSYATASNTCSVTDTLTARGTSVCGTSVTNFSAATTCPLTTLPSITCPTNLVLAADAGQCSRSDVTFVVAATNYCGSVSVESAPPSGSTFPVGTTTVTNTATDASNNQAVCTFTVTINDTQAPSITCPADVTVSTDTNSCAATGVNLGTPVTGDNCAVASVTSNAPASYPLGTNTVTWIVTDTSGNTNSCTQRVIVRDTQPPAITCPGDLTLTTDPGHCSRSNVIYAVTFSDNCSATLTQTAGLPSGATFPKGTTTNRFVVTDGSGNSNTCSFTVTVVDTEPPAITCPPNLTVNASNGVCYASDLNLGTPVTSDNCAVASVTSNAPSIYPVGTNTVIWTVTDTSGNTNTCTQLVIVVDNQTPVITCPASNIVVNAAAGSCVSNVAFVVTATDNCGTIASLMSSPPSGSSFPVGTTTVTNIAVDASGNSNSCTFTVTVLDNQPPAIACPSDLAFSTDPGHCSRSNVIYTVTFSDNCSATLVQTAGLPSGATFPKGVTTNRFVVTDASGNTNSCAFTVTVTDNEPPAIACPADVTVSADTNSCAATGVNLGTPVTGDNCAVAGVTSNGPASYPLGTNTVTWIVTDTSGNTNTCTQRVIVRDTQPPAINCPGNLTLPTDPGQCSRSNVTYTVTFSDNCLGAMLVQTAGLPSGATFPKGVTTNHFVVTDASGNSNTCAFTVTIVDPEPPSIICPATNITVNAANGSCASNVTFKVTATDNCGTVASVVSSPPSGSIFPVGITTVTNIAVDASGNTNTCTFTVTVLDNQPPVITCPTNLVLSTDPGRCSRSNVTYSVTFSDNCTGVVLAQTAGLPGGATFPKGVTTNRFVATDGSGNTNTCSFTVTVTDDEPPTITCPPDVTVSANTNSCVATGVVLGIPVTGDNCAVADLTNNAPAIYPLGTNVVTWSVSDTSGNLRICRQNVFVRDTQAPVITCPGNLSFTTNPGRCSRSNVIYAVTFSDNCPATLAQTAGMTSGATFPKGTTTNRFVVTDGSGNTNTCSFTVTVTDIEPPAITCPADVTISADTNACAATGVNLGTPVIGDNCAVATLINNAPFSQPLGTNTVTWTVTDTSGNTNTCTQRVIVRDTQSPAITCPGNLTLPTDPGRCSRSNVTYAVTFSDNCTGAVLVQTAGSVNGATFPKGTTTNRFTVTDGSGNLNSCSFTVTILDSEPPAITCPTNLTVDANFSGGATNVALGSPVATDNCAVTGVTSNAPAVFPVGTNFVTWTVADTSGNTNSCPQRVVVIALPPVIICPADVTVFANTNSCSATNVNLGTPLVTNYCGTFTVTNNAPASFPLGTNLVTWSVTNTCGKSASCQQRVIVRDGRTPAIFCPGNLAFSTDPGRCTRSNVNYAVTFSDNCSGATLAQTAGLTNGATFPKGTTTNRFVATDGSGNTNFCFFTVTVADTEPPAITCPTNLSVNTVPGGSGVTNLALGSPVTTDNCAVGTVSNNAPAVLPVGTNLVTWTATDTSGNSTACTQRVVVIRTCAGDLTATALTNVTVCASFAAGFTTVASSHDPIAYTWKFNSQTLPGYTNNSLLLPVVAVTNSGLYTVEVRTECAAVTNSATLTVIPLPDKNPVSYTNADGIILNTFGTATPYGSVMLPQCVTNIVKNVTVLLHGFTHRFPADVGILLVSPDGRAVKLMTAAGGGNAVTNLDLFFTDATNAVPSPVPPLVSGTYHPSDYQPNMSLPQPAPGKPYSTNLSTFIGADPNGSWKLYVNDTSPGDGGYIVSWSLNIEWLDIGSGGGLMLQNPRRLGNGTFQAEVLVTPGLTSVVHWSTNLTEWTPLATNVFSNYPGIFMDTQASPFRYRFYRAVLQP